MRAFFKLILPIFQRRNSKKAPNKYFRYLARLHIYSFPKFFTLVPSIRSVLPFSNVRGTLWYSHRRFGAKRLKLEIWDLHLFWHNILSYVTNVLRRFTLRLIFGTLLHTTPSHDRRWTLYFFIYFLGGGFFGPIYNEPHGASQNSLLRAKRACGTVFSSIEKEENALIYYHSAHWFWRQTPVFFVWPMMLVNFFDT